MRISFFLPLLFILPTFVANAEPISKARAAYDSRDYRQILGVVKPLAEMGDPEAEYLLGKEYETGGIITKDPDTAKLWLQKSAAQGYAEASWEIGTITSDRKEAEKWIRKAVEQGGNSYAMRLHSMELKSSPSLEKLRRDALEAENSYRQEYRTYSIQGVCWYTAGPDSPLPDLLFSRLAEQGNSVAQCSLGLSYDSGADTTRLNDIKAEAWLTKAAEQGNPVAQSRLANIFELGRDKKPDLKLAFKWYKQAAENGDAHAQGIIAAAYLIGKSGEPDKDEMLFLDRANDFGQFVDRDEKEAVKWFRRAAAQGDLDGAIFLSNAYREGKHGLPKDYVQAWIWRSIRNRIVLSRSAWLDPPQSEIDRLNKYLAEYELGMTPLEIAHAKQLCAEWRKRDEISEMVKPKNYGP